MKEKGRPRFIGFGEKPSSKGMVMYVNIPVVSLRRIYKYTTSDLLETTPKLGFLCQTGLHIVRNITN